MIEKINWTIRFFLSKSYLMLHVVQMVVFLILAIGLPYLFDLGPSDELNQKSHLVFLSVLAVYLLSDIFFLLIFGLSEYRKQKLSQESQISNLFIYLLSNLILSQINLAKIYINFAFVKIIFDIGETDYQDQGEYFKIFLVAAMVVCIVSQLPNVYSLIRTFDTLLGLQLQNQSKTVKEEDEII